MQRRTACKIEYGRQGAPKWPTGSGKLSKQLLLNKLFDPSTPSMRKGCDGEKKKSDKKSEYQGSGAGGTCSLPATPPHPLIEHSRQGLEIGQTLFYWTLESTFVK